MEEELYSTTDINVACALRSAGYKLHGLDKMNKTKTKFVFISDEAIQGIILSYINQELCAPVKDILNNLRELKTLLLQKDAI